MYETLRHENLIIKIYQDENPESPNDWECPENGAFIVTTKNRHFQVLQKDYDVNTIAEHMQTHKLYHQHRVYPLFAYVHSGVSLSLGRGYPFNCPWDSGQIGYVLVNPKGIKDPDKTAESIVKTWNQYLSGDVYRIEIEDADGNNLDSCCRFYGWEYAKDQALEMAKSVFENLKTDLVI